MHIFIKYLILPFFIISTSYASYNLEEKEFIKNHPIINVGVERYWPPFDFVENGKYTGLAKDYLDLIEKKTNLKFNYVVDSWENLLIKAKNKELDLLPILAKDKNRENFLLFTEKYLTIRDYIYTKSSRNDIRSENDFKGKTIALPEGYIQADYFKKNYPNTKIYLTKNIMETIDAIITNKADFLVSNSAIMNYLLNKHSINQIDARFNLKYSGSNLHMATRNDYLILKNIIQKAINDINLNEKKEIHSKWLNVRSTKVIKKSLKLSEKELEFIKNKNSITIANELGWIPYDFFEDNTPKGYVIDYLKLLCEKVGLKPIFITDKWSTLFSQFEKGNIDVLPVVSFNKKRESFTNYTKSYLSQELVIVTNENTTNIINKDDLKNKKIGMVKDWNLTKFFRENYPNTTLIEFDSLKDVFIALKENFVDATIQNKLIATYYIRKDYFDELKIVSSITLNNFDGKLFIGVKKDLNILLGILNKAIENVSGNELKILNDKWINNSNTINFTKKEQDFIDNVTVKTLTSEIWPPFSFKQNNTMYGINIDLWKYISKKINLKTQDDSRKYLLDTLDEFKNKNADLILGVAKTKEKEKYALFSNKFFESPIAIVTLQDKNYISDASKLLGKKIAVGKDYTSHKLLEEKYPNMNFVFVKSVKEGLEYVNKNLAYAYVDILPVLDYSIQNYGYTNLKISGETGLDFKLSFMISKENEVLQSILNKTLRSLNFEEKNKIINKWLKAKVETPKDYSLLWKIILIFLIIIAFIIYKNRQMASYQKKLEQSQKDTKKSLKNFRTLIDLNIAGILIIRNKKIKYLNNECIKILGYKSKSELINQKVSIIFAIKEIDKLCELLSEVTSYEINAIKADNTSIPILLKGKKAEFDDQVSHIISIIDLSEIKNKEKLLQEQSKLASLGEMIGNIAHQWRQPLSAISTTASGVKLQKEYGLLEDKIFYEAMDTITETSKFLSQTIDDFRNYIKDTKEKKYFNIKSSLERVLSIMKGSFTNNFIEIENSIQDFRINNYENEFTQVLLNILSNSKDALKNIEEKDRKIYIYSSQKDNNYILSIVDTGGGIPSHIIDKIFEPYFTTKHKSQGTGLGLYMTHKMIKESMGADIKIENCIYKNYRQCTKVNLTIPIN